MRLFTFLNKMFNRAPALHYDKAYCRIYFHNDVRAVHLDWNGQATPAQFREACNFSLQLLIEKQAIKMVADNSKVITVSVENQNWLIEDWFPRAVEEGFQYSAVIQSDKVSVQSALQLIVSKISNKLVVVQYFNHLNTAKDWLSQVK